MQMLDGPDSSTNEFNNIGFNVNIAKFINYHNKGTESSNRSRDTTKESPSFDSNLDKTTVIQSRSSRINSRLNVSCEESSNSAGRNFSMTCIEKNLTSIPHEIMQKQTLLTVLDLSKNKFEQLPLEILLIKPLRILKLDHNRIKYLPNDIIKLTYLEALSISHNLLQRIPSQVGRMLRFRELNVEANAIDSINKEIPALKNLRELNLLHNKLILLPCAFKDLPNLLEFHFEWFKYAKPPLDAHQQGKEGEYNLKKLKNKLNELYHKDIAGISFSEFIYLFSKQSADKTIMEKHMQTILHLACSNEDIGIIRLLLRDRPELLESIDEEGMTPLCLSLLNDKVKAAYYLLKNWANVFSSVSYHGSPIHIAAKRLNYGAIKDIVRQGEDPNRIDCKGNTPLHYVIIQMGEGPNKAGHIIQYLLEQGANPNAKNKENWAPIHLLARRRDCKALSWMLSYNFEVQEIHGRDEIFNVNKGGGGYKWSALHIAASTDAPDIVKILGEAEVNMFKRSATGYTPKMVMKRGGLTLKLLEKFEKEWIKKNILFKKDLRQESLSPFNLKNLNSTREIKNASKNKFGETSFRHHATDIMRNRFELFAPLRGSGIIFQHEKFDNSLDISPETETNTDSLDETDTARDICSEISENVKIDTDAYSNELPFCRKASNQIQGNSLTNYNHPSLKEKNSYNIFQPLDFEISVKFSKFERECDFNLESCAREVTHLKELILLDKTNISDKINLIFGLKLLYFRIVDHVYNNFYGLGDKRKFPWYILQESFKRVRDQEKFRSANLATQEIIAYYEIVPQSLISLFIKLGMLNFESQLLKMFIVEILTDLKYFPAMDLLNNVCKDPLETPMVTREAHKANLYLQSVIEDGRKESNDAIKSKGQENHGSRKIFKDKNARVLQLRVENK